MIDKFISILGLGLPMEKIDFLNIKYDRGIKEVEKEFLSLIEKDDYNVDEIWNLVRYVIYWTNIAGLRCLKNNKKKEAEKLFTKALRLTEPKTNKLLWELKDEWKILKISILRNFSMLYLSEENYESLLQTLSEADELQKSLGVDYYLIYDYSTVRLILALVNLKFKKFENASHLAKVVQKNNLDSNYYKQFNEKSNYKNLMLFISSYIQYLVSKDIDKISKFKESIYYLKNCQTIDQDIKTEIFAEFKEKSKKLKSGKSTPSPMDMLQKSMPNLAADINAIKIKNHKDKQMFFGRPTNFAQQNSNASKFHLIGNIIGKRRSIPTMQAELIESYNSSSSDRLIAPDTGNSGSVSDKFKNSSFFVDEERNFQKNRIKKGFHSSSSSVSSITMIQDERIKKKVIETNSSEKFMPIDLHLNDIRETLQKYMGDAESNNIIEQKKDKIMGDGLSNSSIKFKQINFLIKQDKKKKNQISISTAQLAPFSKTSTELNEANDPNKKTNNLTKEKLNLIEEKKRDSDDELIGIINELENKPNFTSAAKSNDLPISNINILNEKIPKQNHNEFLTMQEDKRQSTERRIEPQMPLHALDTEKHFLVTKQPNNIEINNMKNKSKDKKISMIFNFKEIRELENEAATIIQKAYWKFKQKKFTKNKKRKGKQIIIIPNVNTEASRGSSTLEGQLNFEETKEITSKENVSMLKSSGIQIPSLNIKDISSNKIKKIIQSPPIIKSRASPDHESNKKVAEGKQAEFFKYPDINESNFKSKMNYATDDNQNTRAPILSFQSRRRSRYLDIITSPVDLKRVVDKKSVSSATEEGKVTESKSSEFDNHEKSNMIDKYPQILKAQNTIELRIEEEVSGFMNKEILNKESKMPSSNNILDQSNQNHMMTEPSHRLQISENQQITDHLYTNQSNNSEIKEEDMHKSKSRDISITQEKNTPDRQNKKHENKKKPAKKLNNFKKSIFSQSFKQPKELNLPLDKSIIRLRPFDIHKNSPIQDKSNEYIEFLTPNDNIAALDLGQTIASQTLKNQSKEKSTTVKNLKRSGTFLVNATKGFTPYLKPNNPKAKNIEDISSKELFKSTFESQIYHNLLNHTLKFHKAQQLRHYTWTIRFYSHDIKKIKSDVSRIGLIILRYIRLDLEIPFVQLPESKEDLKYFTTWPLVLHSLILWFQKNNLETEYQESKNGDSSDSFEKDALSALHNNNNSGHLDCNHHNILSFKLSKLDKQNIFEIQKRVGYLIDKKIILINKSNGKTLYFINNNGERLVKKLLIEDFLKFRNEREMIKKYCIDDIPPLILPNLDSIRNSEDSIQNIEKVQGAPKISKLIGNYVIFQGPVKIHKIVLVQVSMNYTNQIKAQISSPKKTPSYSPGHSPHVAFKDSPNRAKLINSTDYAQNENLTIRLLNCFDEVDSHPRSKLSVQDKEWNKEVEEKKFDKFFNITREDFIAGFDRLFGIDLTCLYYNIYIKKKIKSLILQNLSEIFTISDYEIVLSPKFLPKVEENKYLFKKELNNLMMLSSNKNTKVLLMSFEYKKPTIINLNEYDLLFEKNFQEIYDNHFRNKKEFMSNQFNQEAIDDNHKKNSNKEEIIQKFKNKKKYRNYKKPKKYFIQNVVDNDDPVIYAQRVGGPVINTDPNSLMINKLLYKNKNNKYYINVKTDGYGYMHYKFEFCRDFIGTEFIHLSSYSPFREQVYSCRIFNTKLMEKIVTILNKSNSQKTKFKSLAFNSLIKSELHQIGRTIIIDSINYDIIYLQKRNQATFHPVFIKMNILRGSPQLEKYFEKLTFYFLAEVKKVGRCHVAMRIYNPKKTKLNNLIHIAFDIFPLDSKTQHFRLILNSLDIEEFWNISTNQLFQVSKNEYIEFGRAIINNFSPQRQMIYRKLKLGIKNYDKKGDFRPYILANNLNVTNFDNKIKSSGYLQATSFKPRIIHQLIKKFNHDYYVITIEYVNKFDHWNIILYNTKTSRSFLSKISFKDIMKLKLEFLDRIYPVFMDKIPNSQFKNFKEFQAAYIKRIVIQIRQGSIQGSELNSNLLSKNLLNKIRELYRQKEDVSIFIKINKLNGLYFLCTNGSQHRNNNNNHHQEEFKLPRHSNTFSSPIHQRYNSVDYSIKMPSQMNTFNIYETIEEIIDFHEIQFWENFIRPAKLKFSNHGNCIIQVDTYQGILKEFLYKVLLQIDKTSECIIEIFLESQCSKNINANNFTEELNVQSIINQNPSSAFENITYLSSINNIVYVKIYYLNFLYCQEERINLREVVNLYIADGFYKYQANYIDAKLNLAELQNLGDYIIYKIKNSNLIQLLHERPINEVKIRINSESDYNELIDTENKKNILYQVILRKNPYLMARFIFIESKKIIMAEIYSFVTGLNIVQKELLISDLEKKIPLLGIYLKNKLYKLAGRKVYKYMLEFLSVYSQFYVEVNEQFKLTEYRGIRKAVSFSTML